MGVFNRFVVSIIGIIILAGAVIVLLTTSGMVVPSFLPGGVLATQLQSIAEAARDNMSLYIGISLVAAVIGIALLVLELATIRRRQYAVAEDSTTDDIIVTNFSPLRKQDTIVMYSTEKGITSIDVESLSDLAENVGITLQNVHRFDSKIGRNADGLLLSCRAVTALGSNAIEVSAKLRSRIIEAIEQLTGLHVAIVNIKVVYDSPKKQAEQLAVR